LTGKKVFSISQQEENWNNLVVPVFPFSWKTDGIHRIAVLKPGRQNDLTTMQFKWPFAKKKEKKKKCNAEL